MNYLCAVNITQHFDGDDNDNDDDDESMEIAEIGCIMTIFFFHLKNF